MDSGSSRSGVRRFISLLAVVAIGLVSAAAADVGAAPHAYYLFLAGTPQGCEDCYVPLLITEKPLGEVLSSGRDSAVVLITTYERDSIWKLERDVLLAAADISAPERVVRLRGRRYRWQGISPAEVLRLLEKPEGSIPVHRVVPVPDKKSLDDLIAAFRGRN
jgi:hypothetical protein